MKENKIQNKVPFAIFSILLIFVLTSHAFATTYYVSTSGDDSNPGTAGSPWRTIQKAANTLAAGDTVTVNTGTYDENVIASRSGTSGSRIAYICSGKVTVQKFFLTGNYITIDGFTITNASANWQCALHFNGSNCIAQNCTIEDVHGSGCLSGVLFYTSSSSNSLLNSAIRRCNANNGMVAIYGTNNIVQGCDFSNPDQNDDRDAIHVFGSGHTIRRNYFHDWSWPSGTPHMDFIQTYSGDAAKNVLVENNFAWSTLQENSGGFGPCFIMGEDGQDWIIRNNIVRSVDGVKHFGSGSPSGFKVYNNTFIGDLTDPSGDACGVNIENTNGDDIRNNIFIDKQLTVGIYSGNTNYIIDYNLKYNRNGSTPGGQGQQAHDVWKQNPQFVNLGGSTAADYKLQSGSPARDAGATIVSIKSDYYGIPRPQGSYYDIGADEYTTLAMPPAPPSGLKVIPSN